MAHDMPNAGVPSAGTTVHTQCLHQIHYFKHMGPFVQQGHTGEPVAAGQLIAYAELGICRNQQQILQKKR
ncbi:hypothetical protein T01_10986 [Trichinella spiralis]|uniref:Uncharacterized protein n=1 Tax=Trichinella spiralis TaxID=6334 RepID=A0A0V1BUA2_TRISP|nr:hypothetical protein T01_10986 [Trichinella spiralis]